MTSIRNIYICSNCGDTTPKWVGKCPQCGEWNTLIEDAVSHATYKDIEANAREPVSLGPRETEEKKPLITEIDEFNRVLGGKITPGSFSLLTGDPGIGKSTLALQIAGDIATQKKKVLYISAEESIGQVTSRAERLGITSNNLQMISETNLEIIMATLEKTRPDFIIADSAQVFHSSNLSGAAGNIAQTRNVAENLMRFAKGHQIPAILIGHVTKTGDLAGPRALEHLVDTVLYLEGERYQNFRLLRCTKNRFGSTNELGVFEMTEKGMQEVKNPSEAFLEGRKKDAIGSVVTATIEGTRPFLVEVQALTTTANFSYPKRTTSGTNINRLQLLIAVLTKHAKIKLDNQDVFLNVAGGFKIQEPAADLAISIAIASSRLERPVDANTII
ncbi:MAG TPA: DNA repair protein RadA, partial [Candidatus Peregrinibacteria bacterium]|nr:DNA repair protein RadA [Candidatus Peregrinibacteria bacterium]